MTTETNSTNHDQPKLKINYRGGASAPVYGIGLIGAWVYYISHAATFWLGVLGIFKGILWPAILVYELMKYLNM